MPENTLEITPVAPDEYRMRDFAIPAAVAWLLAFLTRFIQTRSGEMLAALSGPRYMPIAPEVWWCGFFLQIVICIFAPMRFMPHSRSALFMMTGYWICLSANSIFLVAGHNEMVR
ncbi:MAG TPA: hypothetical protein VN578_21070 [Candidatus Binatia bacterium]|jgi:hypothetical protein|nr:hypothetical protein [Candidatus Binatia bacterium]